MTRIIVCVTAEFKKRILEAKQKTGMTMSSIIKIALNEYFEKVGV